MWYNCIHALYVCAITVIHTAMCVVTVYARPYYVVYSSVVDCHCFFLPL